jgi:hypothetical protein
VDGWKMENYGKKHQSFFHRFSPPLFFLINLNVTVTLGMFHFSVIIFKKWRNYDEK